MSFQQNMYALFWIAMAITAAGAILALLNDRKVEGISYWLFFIALPMLILGIPALLNQHVFHRNQQREKPPLEETEHE